MKSIVSMFVVGLLAQEIAVAQGTTTYVSNLGFSSTGTSPVGSDSWLAGVFRTGTNAGGYVLNSVQLALGDASGTPSGFTAMVYTAGGISTVVPGTSLGTLNGSLDPVAAGIYTYNSASDLTLSPSTYYFIVLTAGTPVAASAYQWNVTTTYPAAASGGWSGAAYLFSSSDGLSWRVPPTRTPGQFALAATGLPVPEPSILGLLVLGSGFLFWRRRKATSH